MAQLSSCAMLDVISGANMAPHLSPRQVRCDFKSNHGA